MSLERILFLFFFLGELNSVCDSLNSFLKANYKVSYVNHILSKYRTDSCRRIKSDYVYAQTELSILSKPNTQYSLCHETLVLFER